MKKIYSIFVCLCLLAGFVACEKDKDFALNTLAVNDEMVTPSFETAEVSCSFKADATISDAFVQYSLSSSFAKYEVAKMTEDKGKYTAHLTDLVDDTTYYIRYSVSNKYSSVVAEKVVEFKTLPCTVPTIVVDSIADVKENQAKVHLRLTSNGGAVVTDMGICWSKQANPTTKDIHKSTDDTLAVLDITDLQSNTQYYVRAYAMNKIGIAYSEEVVFTTLKQVVLPTVTTTSATSVTETSAVTGGNVTSDGGASSTERGVVYSTTQNPTVANSKVASGSGTGAFTCNLTGLQSNTTYFVRAYAVNSKGTAYGDEVSFTTKEGVMATPEYVDLGLSVKWATFNVGATKPEEYGDYFAWGETEPKAVYKWSTYKWCNGSSSSLTKYCTSSSYGIVDNKTTLELSDDAARANWGGNWRMPTKAEQDELHEQCTWTWTTQNGVNGYKVTSNSNKSIFLPAAGHRDDNSLYSAGSESNYWSSSLSPVSPYYAYYLLFNSSYVDWDNFDNRYYGFSVRPVYAPQSEQTTAPTVVTSAVTQITETTAVAGGNVMSDGNASVTERGVVYSTNPNPVITNLSNTIRPCGSGIGEFTYTMSGLQPNTTYYVRAYAKNDVGTAYGEEVSFMTLEEVSATPEYVDLGLPSGIKWADRNIGANKPEDYGDYFAWGETEPKEMYDQNTYKWYSSASSGLTKYCTNSSYGNVDNKTVLEASDDAATANWGGQWRMPTKEERDELYEYCDWEWVERSNGVSGYQITSEINGNSIFLPLAGCKDGDWVNSYYGFYWTSSLHLDDNWNAYDVNFQLGGSIIMNDDSRFNGRSVRPVYGPRTEMANTENGHAYVDLGLSVKWATMNVGASKSEDYGDYFAWGEIAPKEEYSWSTYTYCNGSSSSLTKYNYNSSLGFVDNKTQLELSDDAARANWGGKWRMPTDAELTELREQCTWTWSKENGVNGYKVTSRINGKSIFLPAAGNRTGPSLGSVGDGYYWSSSISTEGSPVGAYYLYFLSGSVNRYDGSRDDGQSVRPVCP